MRNTARKLPQLFLLVLAILAAACVPRNNDLRDAEGLWEYTDLITKDGQSLPLTGVFLIKNGIFLQQGIFTGEPFATRGSMAHVGPYWAGGAGLRLTSKQTLSIDPGEDKVLTSAGVMEHDLKVTREGDELTLVFGGGTSTIQTFRRLGDASDAQLFNFSDGGLAFADGYFILVIGDSKRAVTGYGKYARAGDTLTLDVIRWAESDGSDALNMKDISLTATFDGKVLTLPDGRSFSVVR